LVYQETYHQEVYKEYHPKGKKSNFDFRLETPDRIGKAGIHKIGLGVLLGLEDWRWTVFSMPYTSIIFKNNTGKADIQFHFRASDLRKELLNRISSCPTEIYYSSSALTESGMKIWRFLFPQEKMKNSEIILFHWVQQQ
jgi:hypothetical protein